MVLIKQIELLFASLFASLFFRSVTVLADSTQSTLVNKTSNETTADTNDREIHPLPIIMPLIGMLVIAVIIIFVAWKIKRRRKSCKGCKCFMYASFD